MNVIYLRVSKNDDYQSSEHQKKSCIEFCKNHNIKIDDIIEDSNISAYSKDWNLRPGFSKVVQLTDDGKLENLVCFETSRISRQFISGQVLIDHFTQRGTKVWSVTDGKCINDDDLSMLMNSFKFFMDMKSSQQTSQRIRSQKRMARDRGDFLGHKLLWGFKVIEEDGRKIEVVDEEIKPIIIEMFETYINSGAKECMNKYNIGSNAVLLQKLKNDKYRKIVGDVLFDRTQEVIKNRYCKGSGNTRNLNRSKNIFEGLLKHEYCGGNLSISYERNGSTIYRCRRCKGNYDIKVKKSFNKKLSLNLEKEIEEVLDSLDHEELEKRYNSRCGNKKSIIGFKIKELNNLLLNKEKALKMASMKLERYIVEDASDIMISTISNMIDTTRKEIENIKDELNKNNEELNKLNQDKEHQEELIKEVLNAKEIYKNASNEKKKSILNLLIKKIVVSDVDKFDIFLNI